MHRKCNGCHKNHLEKLIEDVETVTNFSYIGNRIYPGGGCEEAVTSNTRLGWAKFRDLHDVLCRKHFL